MPDRPASHAEEGHHLGLTGLFAKDLPGCWVTTRRHAAVTSRPIHLVMLDYDFTKPDTSDRSSESGRSTRPGIPRKARLHANRLQQPDDPCGSIQ